MPFGLQAHHLPGRQVHDGHQGLAHQLLRLVELVDAERICRSVPVPSSRVNFSSFSLFFTASQAFTFTTRKSDLQKVSKSTFSVSWGSTSTAGRAAFRASASAASSSARALSMSSRGKRFSPW